jgi:hypothetical protein
VVAGQTATFTAGVSADPTAAVQWQVSTGRGRPFHNIAGATATTLTVSTTPGSASGARYRAVCKNALGRVVTQTATLVIYLPPTITHQPANHTVAAGRNVKFTAAAGGRPEPTVQWQVSSDGGKTFNDIAGATRRTLAFTAAAGQNGDLYRAVFTNPAGQAVTDAVQLVIAE